MENHVVLGASSKPARYSYKAVRSLQRRGYSVIPVGLRTGIINDREILTGQPVIDNVHSILLYLGPERQPEYYQYIIDLKPRRLIFNPGTVNQELINLAEKNGIATVTECALVMINSGRY